MISEGRERVAALATRGYICEFGYLKVGMLYDGVCSTADLTYATSDWLAHSYLPTYLMPPIIPPGSCNTRHYLSTYSTYLYGVPPPASCNLQRQ